MFRAYHYLNSSLGVGVRCYSASYQNKPVAFIAVAAVKMKTMYYRVSRLVVLPDYQGIGIGKQLLNFIAQFYTTQTKLPFHIVPSNPQIIRGNNYHWEIARFGHANMGRNNSKINDGLTDSLSRNRLTVTMKYHAPFCQ
jgi:GNAT superfamily N-acetyltransferase